MPKFVFYFPLAVHVFPLTWEVRQSYTSNAPWGKHNPTFETVWELRISANASPYGFLGFVENSTLNILSGRGLAHSERQRNVNNVTLRNTELHNTKKAIYSSTPKITFIKHPKK